MTKGLSLPGNHYSHNNSHNFKLLYPVPHSQCPASLSLSWCPSTSPFTHKPTTLAPLLLLPLHGRGPLHSPSRRSFLPALQHLFSLDSQLISTRDFPADTATCPWPSYLKTSSHPSPGSTLCPSFSQSNPSYNIICLLLLTSYFSPIPI